MRSLLAAVAAVTALTVLASWVTPATAAPAQPQPGMWWNPAESGRGWALDPQGDVMVVTTFAYDDSGNMQWYYASGPLVNGGYGWSGQLLKFNVGQPLNGGYRPPLAQGSDGVLVMEFTSRATGFVTLPGGRRIPIERQNFGVGEPPVGLRGQWAFVYAIGASWFVDVYNLSTMGPPTTNGNGTVLDGPRRAGFELQTQGVLAGKVVGFRFSASGTTLDQYIFDHQLEEGRGDWVSPISFNQYGMNGYKTHVPSGMSKALSVDEGLAEREGKGAGGQAKGITISDLELRNPELGAIAREMWKMLQR